MRARARALPLACDAFVVVCARRHRLVAPSAWARAAAGARLQPAERPRHAPAQARALHRVGRAKGPRAALFRQDEWLPGTWVLWRRWRVQLRGRRYNRARDGCNRVRDDVSKHGIRMHAEARPR
eukprot:3267336-Pleurochrysis_carterae.AAC.2